MNCCKYFIWIYFPLFSVSGGKAASVSREDGIPIEKHKMKTFLKFLLLEESPLEYEKDGKILGFICSTCEEIFQDLIDTYKNGTNLHDIMQEMADKCVELGIATAEVCEGYLFLNEPIFQYVFDNKEKITGKDMCGTMFVTLRCESDNEERKWQIEIPDTVKPPPDDTPYDYSVPTMKILHLTDTHYDPEYIPGSNVKCPNEFLCCRESSEPATEEDKAGFWGESRNCDSPKWLLELIYSHIRETHPDIDFIIWTGDLVPHKLWDTSQEENLSIINEMADLISKHFPNTPLFPALGNHEGHPGNTFPQPYIEDENFDISWLYDELDKVWSRWLLNDTSSTIKDGGYYVTNIFSGLKILSVNSNYGYSFNWWLLLDDKDIANILTNMTAILQDAEDNGEFVYITSHIAPGSSDFSYTWSHEYNKIVARYENTISGLFYGHTHNDQFEIFFDPEDPERAIEVGYIAPSQSPKGGRYPAYKIYTVEGDFEGSRYRVLDHESWIMDLDLANSDNITTFFKLYNAKTEYGLDDLSPDSMYKLVNEMSATDSFKFDKYFRNFYSGGPGVSEGCDGVCKKARLCELLVSDNSDRSRCK